MVFHNREHAAEILASRLKEMNFAGPLVLAIPRGAVPMGRVIAEELAGDLDVVLVHKFCPKWHPELAVGAVTEDGEILVNEEAHLLGFSDSDIDRAAQEQLKKLQARRELYTPYRKAIDPAGREVIIVDDGIATGATIRAAVQLLLKKKVSRMVVAAPVASLTAANQLREEGVETCILSTPIDFYAVSQFYQEFSQVEDEEVTRILTTFARPTKIVVPERQNNQSPPDQSALD